MHNSLHNNFLKAVASLGLRFPVRDLHNKTGYSTSVVSEYLNSNRPVSERFAKVFCEVYGFSYEAMAADNEMEIRTDSTIQEPDEPYSTKDDGLTFHDRIKLVREKKGYTQQQMADLLDMHRSQYGRVEQGDIGMKIDDLIHYCITLNISADWLLLGRDKMQYKPATSKLRSFFNNLATQITLSGPSEDHMKPIRESLQQMDDTIKELGEDEGKPN